jgi:hypothetical protein
MLKKKIKDRLILNKLLRLSKSPKRYIQIIKVQSKLQNQVNLLWLFHWLKIQVIECLKRNYLQSKKSSQVIMSTSIHSFKMQVVFFKSHKKVDELIKLSTRTVLVLQVQEIKNLLIVCESYPSLLTKITTKPLIYLIWKIIRLILRKIKIMKMKAYRRSWIKLLIKLTINHCKIVYQEEIKSLRNKNIQAVHSYNNIPH